MKPEVKWKEAETESRPRFRNVFPRSTNQNPKRLPSRSIQNKTCLFSTTECLLWLYYSTAVCGSIFSSCRVFYFGQQPGCEWAAPLTNTILAARNTTLEMQGGENLPSLSWCLELHMDFNSRLESGVLHNTLLSNAMSQCTLWLWGVQLCDKTSANDVKRDDVGVRIVFRPLQRKFTGQPSLN